MGRRTAARNTVMVRRPTATQMSAAAAASKSGKAAATPGDGDVDSLDIASLTLDTPLIPFAPKRKVPSKPFTFLLLPSEMRIKVYEHFFDDEDASVGEVLDLCPANYKRFHRKLGLIRVCRQIYDEATHFFYSTRSFRIFPTFPGRYFKTKKPLLARMKPKQRACITSLEFCLGPGWANPPRGWVVNDALGLADCINVQKLLVFVECDPSDKFYNGFRRGDGFYEGFCRNLLTELLEALPAVTAVEFDGHPGVKKSGDMMQGLLGVVTDKVVTWGPKRGWSDDDPDEEKVTLTGKAIWGMKIGH